MLLGPETQLTILDIRVQGVGFKFNLNSQLHHQIA